MRDTQLVRTCRDVLARQGLHGVLATLNATVPHRYTGIYRFDGRWMRNVWLFDREHPNIQFGSDVLWDDSYCKLTVANGDACVIADALADPRLAAHPSRETVRSYVAVALHPEPGAAVTLCHFDVLPREAPASAVVALRAVRPLIEAALRVEFVQVTRHA